MIKNLKKLIETLRDELKNYGEMLALLDRQQEHLITRDANEVSQSINQVQAQGAVIQEARERREECFRSVARAATQPETVAFADLIPALPSDYQPLLKALMDENNELLGRVRLRADQNHLILQRSVDLMQQVMTSLGPPTGPDSEKNSRGKSPGRARGRRHLQEELN